MDTRFVELYSSRVVPKEDPWWPTIYLIDTKLKTIKKIECPNLYAEYPKTEKCFSVKLPKTSIESYIKQLRAFWNLEEEKEKFDNRLE